MNLLVKKDELVFSIIVDIDIAYYLINSKSLLHLFDALNFILSTPRTIYIYLQSTKN